MANEIRFQPPASTLVRGQTITVPIVLALERRLKVRGIHAKFLGAEETKAVYTTTRTDSKGRVTTQTHTAVQQVEIVSQRHLLAGNEQKGFFESQKPINCRRIRVQLVGVESSEAHGHKDTHIHLGTPHDLDSPGTVTGSYTKEFSLPAEVAAPLTASGKLFSIAWFVQIELDVPWAKDPKIRVPVTLLPTA